MKWSKIRALPPDRPVCSRCGKFKVRGLAFDLCWDCNDKVKARINKVHYLSSEENYRKHLEYCRKYTNAHKEQIKAWRHLPENRKKLSRYQIKYHRKRMKLDPDYRELYNLKSLVRYQKMKLENPDKLRELNERRYQIHREERREYAKRRYAALVGLRRLFS